MGHAAPCLAALWLLLAAGAAHAAPAAGQYDARLCVTLADQPASCGPAQVQLGASRLRLRIGDIEYRLALPVKRPAGELIAMLMHGTMQIDEFNAPFEWRGNTLHFDDADKRTRYEVQLGERPRAKQPPVSR